jgi:cobalt/nickel transport protein
VARSYRLEILTLVAIIVFCAAFLYASSTLKDTSFSGTDTLGAAKISGSSGTTQLEIQPLIPQWIPPSPEVESTLFALQAAIGGIFIGGVFGYWIGQKRKT